MSLKCLLWSLAVALPICIVGCGGLPEQVAVRQSALGEPINWALNRPATQSSVYRNWPASLAVDGNTDGNVFHGSVTHTNAVASAWWEVDLGESRAFDTVEVWGRTDDPQ